MNQRKLHFLHTAPAVCLARATLWPGHVKDQRGPKVVTNIRTPTAREEGRSLIYLGISTPPPTLAPGRLHSQLKPPSSCLKLRPCQTGNQTGTAPTPTQPWPILYPFLPLSGTVKEREREHCLARGWWVLELWTVLLNRSFRRTKAEGEQVAHCQNTCNWSNDQYSRVPLAANARNQTLKVFSFFNTWCLDPV